jgi:hypothetical protein
MQPTRERAKGLNHCVSTSEKRPHRRMARREPHRCGMLKDVVQPDGLGLVDLTRNMEPTNRVREPVCEHWRLQPDRATTERSEVLSRRGFTSQPPPPPTLNR